MPRQMVVVLLIDGYPNMGEEGKDTPMREWPWDEYIRSKTNGFDGLEKVTFLAASPYDETLKKFHAVLIDCEVEVE